MSRQNVSSGSQYEPIIGFSRAVRVGDQVFVAGTAPIGPDGKTVGVGDAAAQARRVFQIILEAMRKAGAGPEDVVRTRMYLKDARDWEAVGRVHGEIFANVRPAAMFLQVGGFIDPDWLVEIEADAVGGTAVLDGECVFCRILRGDLAAPLVYQDERTLAFLDARPVFFGHTLVIPREHFETLIDLPPDWLSPVFATARLIARAVRDGLNAEGSLVLMNNRVSQSVPHLHVHVIPRHKGDGLKGFLWPRQRYPDAAAEAQVRDALQATVARLKAEEPQRG